MTPEKNTHHAEDGILKFAAPFWGKPRWAALFVAIAKQIQELEDTFFDIRVKRYLGNATGAQLAVLGRLVGQTDPDLGDEVFRLLIRVRIRINRSEGRWNDIVEVLQLLGIAAGSRLHYASYPAKIVVEIYQPSPIPPALLAQLLNEAATGGVGVIVLTNPSSGSIPFSYSNDTDVPAAHGQNIFSNNTLFGGVGDWAYVGQ